jgi:hypothetical protein
MRFLALDPDTRHRLLWLTLFALAMAQLEAAVVVYLRQLYYPDGFTFPLVIIRDRIAAVEIGREAATVLMLVAVARLATRDPWRRFAAFLLGFGLWDIFYYVWLWVMLKWPESLLTWDVLFLIPLPWVGPVLAPALVAAVMAIAGVAIESLRDRRLTPRVSRLEWGLVVVGAIALLVLFMADAEAVLEGRMPAPFPWVPYGIGLLVPALAAVRAYRRSLRRPGTGS